MIKNIYKCGHRQLLLCTSYMSKDERDIYLRWKYTVGAGGTMDKCYDCYLERVKKGDVI